MSKQTLRSVFLPLCKPLLIQLLTLLPLLLVVLLPPPTFAQNTQTEVIPLSQDTFLSGALKSTNFGHADALLIRSVFPTYPLLGFNNERLHSLLASGNVKNIQLVVPLQRNTRAGRNVRVKVSLHRMRKPWTEGDGQSLFRRGTRGSAGATYRCASDTDITNFRNDCGNDSAWDISKGYGRAPSNAPYDSEPTAEVASFGTNVTALGFDVTEELTAAFSTSEYQEPPHRGCVAAN